MGYVKVKKAAGAFDLVCAENVGTVKASGSGTSLKIAIAYIGAEASRYIGINILGFSKSPISSIMLAIVIFVDVE